MNKNLGKAPCAWWKTGYTNMYNMCLSLVRTCVVIIIAIVLMMTINYYDAYDLVWTEIDVIASVNAWTEPIKWFTDSSSVFAMKTEQTNMAAPTEAFGGKLDLRKKIKINVLAENKISLSLVHNSLTRLKYFFLFLPLQNVTSRESRPPSRFPLCIYSKHSTS